MKRNRWVGSCVAVLAGLVVSSTPAHAVSSTATPEPGHLLALFSGPGKNHQRQYKLELTDLLGGHAKALPVPAGLKPLSLSPDSKKVLFDTTARPGRLIVRTIANGHRTVVTTGCEQPVTSWSRDGRRLYLGAYCGPVDALKATVGWADVSTGAVHWTATIKTPYIPIPGPTGLAVTARGSGAFDPPACPDPSTDLPCLGSSERQTLDVLKIADGSVVASLPLTVDAYQMPSTSTGSGPSMLPISWTPDGFSLVIAYASSFSGSGGVLATTLERVDRKTGHVARLGSVEDDAYTYAITQDGRWVYANDAVEDQGIVRFRLSGASKPTRVPGFIKDVPVILGAGR